MKKSNPKMLAILVVVVMLSALSVGDIPEAVQTTKTIHTIYEAIPSDTVWEDNFDDEDISDWQIFKVNHTPSPDTLMPGNTTAEGGVMRHLGPEWSYAGHNSSVAFGTWNFSVDIQKPVDDWHFYVAFISETFDNDWLTNESMGSIYAVGFFIPDSGDHEIRLVRGDHELGPLWMGYYYDDDIVGWQNIIVTREPSGQFYVYLNEKLILGAKNMDRTTSERFYFASQGGPAIDNVSVSNTIDYDKAPPEWTEPSNQMIDAGTDFSYNLNATDYSGIDQWWINDTVNFAIDNDGVITNNDVLEAGSYVLQVSVNDTLDNTQTGSFKLTVRALPPEPGIPIELVIAGVGAVAVVIIVLVIWRKRS